MKQMFAGYVLNSFLKFDQEIKSIIGAVYTAHVGHQDPVDIGYRLLNPLWAGFHCAQQRK